METEIKLQYGKKPDKFKKDYWEMSPELQEEYKKWQEMNIRENIFSRNQPLVYRRASDNKMIAEYLQEDITSELNQEPSAKRRRR